MCGFSKSLLALSLISLVATISQPANSCPMEKAIKSHLEQVGMTVKSVDQASSYQVSYFCDSLEDCADDKLPVGTSSNFLLTFKYSGAVVTLPEFYSQLLIYDSQQQVILGDALSSWMGSVRARAVSMGGWGRFQAKFDNLFLTQELPKGSQLIMLAEQQNGVFTYHSRAVASVSSAQGLSAPITTAILESSPPKIKWTLKLKRPIAGDIYIRWYVKDLSSGDILDFNSLTTPSDNPSQSTLTLLSSGDDRWAANGCWRVNVYIDRNPVGGAREIFNLPTVVASKFGSDC